MGTQTLQEMNLLDVYRTMTKWQSTISTPERITEIFRRAFTIIEAGRPGPVVIEIPVDIAQAQVDDALYAILKPWALRIERPLKT